MHTSQNIAESPHIRLSDSKTSCTLCGKARPGMNQQLLATGRCRNRMQHAQKELLSCIILKRIRLGELVPHSSCSCRRRTMQQLGLTFGKTAPDMRRSCFGSYNRHVRKFSGRYACLSVNVCRHLLLRMSHTCKPSPCTVHHSNLMITQLICNNVDREQSPIAVLLRE